MSNFPEGFNKVLISDPGTGKGAQVDVDGCVSIKNSHNGTAIAAGEVTGSSFISKFGEAPDFDTSDGAVTMWDGANDAGVNQMVYQYSSTDDIDSIISSNAGDSVDIEIQGLDVNFAQVTQTVTLNGQTRVALGTNLIRVFRMINRGASDLAGVASCYTDNSATTNGVVDDSTKVRAIINGGNNQTLMSVYTVPAGVTAYMNSWFAAVAGANKSSNYKVEIFVRPDGEVFQLKHRSAVSDVGTSQAQHFFKIPLPFAAKSDIEMKVTMLAAGGTAADISGGFDLELKDD